MTKANAKRRTMPKAGKVTARQMTEAVTPDASVNWIKPQASFAMNAVVVSAETVCSTAPPWTRYIDSRLRQFGTR